jgi:hypothetical protein
MHLCSNCQYYSRSQHLNCAVNPAYRGGDCEDFFAFSKFRLGDRVKLVAFDMPWITPYYVQKEAQDMTVVGLVGRMVQAKGKDWPEPVWFRPEHLELIEPDEQTLNESIALQNTMVQLLNSIQEKPMTQVTNTNRVVLQGTPNPFEGLR